jgi:hypothetical protein
LAWIVEGEEERAGCREREGCLPAVCTEGQAVRETKVLIRRARKEEKQHLVKRNDQERKKEGSKDVFCHYSLFLLETNLATHSNGNACRAMVGISIAVCC